MEKIPQNLDDLLAAYLDETLTREEANEVEKKIRESALLKSRFEELRRVHQNFTGSKLETPTKTFTARVMANLERLPSANAISPRNGLILLTGMIVALGIGVMLMGSGFFDSFNGQVDLKTIEVPNSTIKQYLPSIPVNGTLIVKILIGVNLLLALVVLDRTVLRPFFMRKEQVQF